MNNFKIITALITPLNKDKTIDYDKLVTLIDYQINERINSFVLFGTTGEGMNLSLKDKYQITKKLLKRYQDSIELYIGVTEVNKHKLIEEIKKFNRLSITGYLIITPIYLTVSQNGVEKYYEMINKYVEKDFLVYYAPHRTGQRIILDTFLEISKLDHFIGVKFASKEKSLLLNLSKEEIPVYLGNDEYFEFGVKNNYLGLISVISNLRPRLMKQIIDNYKKNNQLFDNSLMEYEKLLKLIKHEPSPIGIKYLVSIYIHSNLTYTFPLTLPSGENQLIYQNYLKGITYEN